MGDAEWMYEDDLDPLYRKDETTGELVEWEGGLNPAYEDYGEPYGPYDEGYSEAPQGAHIFYTFEDAKMWAKENPWRSFTKSPDGNGYIVKDFRSGSNFHCIKKKDNKTYKNIRPLVYEKIKNYLNREEVEKERWFSIEYMRITPELGREIERYILDNDLRSFGCHSKNSYIRKCGSIDSEFNSYYGGGGRIPLKPKFDTSTYTCSPLFTVGMYYTNSEKKIDDCFLCLVGDSGPGKYLSRLHIEKENEKAKRCKTILDLYFDILYNSPKDLIDIKIWVEGGPDDDTPF